MYLHERNGEVLLDANHHLKLKASHVQSRRAVYFRDWQEVLIAASDGTEIFASLKL